MQFFPVNKIDRLIRSVRTNLTLGLPEAKYYLTHIHYQYLVSIATTKVRVILYIPLDMLNSTGLCSDLAQRAYHMALYIGFRFPAARYL